jgi:hypothetical protein
LNEQHHERGGQRLALRDDARPDVPVGGTLNDADLDHPRPLVSALLRHAEAPIMLERISVDECHLPSARRRP